MGMIKVSLILDAISYTGDSVGRDWTFKINGASSGQGFESEYRSGVAPGKTVKPGAVIKEFHIDEADSIAQRVFDCLLEVVDGRPSPRGASPSPSLRGVDDSAAPGGTVAQVAAGTTGAPTVEDAAVPVAAEGAAPAAAGSAPTAVQPAPAPAAAQPVADAAAPAAQ